MKFSTSLYKIFNIILTGFTVSNVYATPIFLQDTNVCPENFHVCTSVETPQMVESSLELNLTSSYLTNVYNNDFDMCNDITYNNTYDVTPTILNTTLLPQRNTFCYVENSILLINETKIVNECVQCTCTTDNYGYSYPECIIDDSCSLYNTTKNSFSNCLGLTQQQHILSSNEYIPNNVACCPNHQCKDANCIVCSKNERDIVNEIVNLPSTCHMCRNGRYLLSGYSNKCLRESHLLNVCENGEYYINNITNTASCYSQPIKNPSYGNIQDVKNNNSGYDVDTIRIYIISGGVFVFFCTIIFGLFKYNKYTKKYYKNTKSNEQKHNTDRDNDTHNIPYNDRIFITNTNPMMKNKMNNMVNDAV